jgi:hypothetical protein
MRLAEGSLRRVLADRADGVDDVYRWFRCRRRAAGMQALLGMVKLDIEDLRRAYGSKSAA